MKERLLVALATLALALVVALSPLHHPTAYADGGPTATPRYSDCQGGNHCGG
jgi:hypothetical protein